VLSIVSFDGRDHAKPCDNVAALRRKAAMQGTAAVRFRAVAPLVAVPRHYHRGSTRARLSKILPNLSLPKLGHGSCRHRGVMAVLTPRYMPHGMSNTSLLWC
jgi:hypothetical protein